MISTPLLLLVGGKGTRMAPLTLDKPKCLLSICGEPFLHWNLLHLKKAGVEHVVLCVGVLGEQIKEFIRDRGDYGVKIDIVDDAGQLLGTGGAVTSAVAELEITDNLLVQYGDSFLNIDYISVDKKLREATESGFSMLMTIFENNNSLDKSNVWFSEGKLVAYDKGIEDYRYQFIDYGLTGFSSRALLDMTGENRVFDLSLVQAAFVRQGQAVPYLAHTRFYEIGSKLGLEHTEQFMREFKWTL